MKILYFCTERTLILNNIFGMKKFFLLAAVAMLTVVNVNAQNEEPRQEIGVSYGWAATSDWLSIFGNIVEAVFGERFGDNDMLIGPISVEYYYHLKPWLGVGAIAAYGQFEQDVVNSDKDVIGNKKTNYLTFMPAVKFDWLRRDCVGLYSKLAVGATMRSEKKTYKDESKQGWDNSDFHVNFQVSAIGVEVGKQLRGFAELGLGEQGVFSVGARYRF